jgi:hypothetical protein
MLSYVIGSFFLDDRGAETLDMIRSGAVNLFRTRISSRSYTKLCVVSR